MYSICLIDDCCYGIPQVIHSIPNDINYEFYYFDRVDFIEPRKYDIILLDYFLDKDPLTGEDIFSTLEAENIIAFSSEDTKNMRLIKKGAGYKARKLRNTVQNPVLIDIMKSLFHNK